MINLCRSGASAATLPSLPKYLWLLLAAASLAGCSRFEEKPAATQVVARVNGHEITVHQVNDVLARQNISGDQAPAVKRQILDRLIDQELAKQQAMEKQLDRTPGTVRAMEAAKNEVLARAYLEQIAATQRRPTPAEIKKYYAEHPELFAQRRLYSLEELSVPQKTIAPAALREQARQAKDLAELTSLLSAQKATAVVNRAVRAAEQLPLAWLGAMQQMKDGDVQVFEGAEQISVVRLVASRSAPVEEATAAPRIEQFLFNRALNKAVEAEVKDLRGKSNIEYAGEFATRDAHLEKGLRSLQ